MKKILILLSLVLAGCVGAETAPLRDDPNIQLAIAGAQLTGTAQAWSMQQVAWTVTAQSWTPTPSVTPSLTPSPTLTFTPTVDVTGTMAVEYMNQEIADLQRENVRKEATNTVLAWLPYIVLALALGLAGFFGYIGAKRLAMMPTPIHEATGKPMPMINVIEGVVSDIDRAPNGMAQLRRGYVAGLPAITADRQATVTNNAQLVDAQSRRANLPKRLVEAQGQKLLEAPAQGSAANEASVADGFPPLPAWELVNGWQGEKNLLPYGLTASGLGFVDVNLYPHWAALGMTGMGKSRRFLRPVIACALAAGHRVVIVGKMTDYGVFANHPNVNLVHVNQMTKPEHAERYGNILLALLAEMEKRDEYLMQVQRSTWAHSGRQNTFIVLDEVQNAIRMMKVAHSANAERVQMGIAGLVSEGRKVGFNIAIAGQRATGLADILSQTGKAIFRVEREEENAHKSLVGASQLNEGYFFARFGHGVKLAGAFEPTDEEIIRFLASRPAQALERDWVDGRIVETFNATLPTPPAVDSLPEPNPRSDLEKLAEAYKDEYQPGMSGNAIGRMIGKPYGGSWKDKIDELREYLDRAVQGQNQNLEGAI